MRYFYTDPIDALYMVVNHGVIIEHYSKYELRECVGIDSSGGMYYIHPDSLELFKPIDGDIGIDSNGYFCVYMDEGGWLLDGHEGDVYFPMEIIRRNNKPFITPEVEE